MNANPAVSIVMGAYNRLEFLKLALNSARQALADLPHEIIIVDGGSDDGSLEWLIQQKDVLTIVQHNRGTFNHQPIPRRSWGYFMNLAFKSAQADYILMMSDDTIFHPHAVKNGLQFIQEQRAHGKNVGAVPFYFHDVGKEPPDQYKIFTLFGYPMLNHGIYLKSALAAVGYADEQSFLFYGADSDICFKLLHAGYDIIPCPTALMLHCENHPLRLMNTPSDKWLHDMTTLLNKWRGIFIPADVTTMPQNPTIQSIAYHDPHHLAGIFDQALAQTDAHHAHTAIGDDGILLNQIQTRLHSILKTAQYAIYLNQKLVNTLPISLTYARLRRWILSTPIANTLRQLKRGRIRQQLDTIQHTDPPHVTDATTHQSLAQLHADLTQVITTLDAHRHSLQTLADKIKPPD